MSLHKEHNRSPEELKKLPIMPPGPVDAKEEEFLRELCEFEFSNLEEPGIMQTFSYGDSKNSHTFKFMHGAKYKLPRFIARHVESRSTPLWDWRPNGLGGLEKKFLGTKQRFQMRQVYSR